MLPLGISKRPFLLLLMPTITIFFFFKLHTHLLGLVLRTSSSALLLQGKKGPFELELAGVYYYNY